MFWRVYLKSALSTIILLSSASGFAAALDLDEKVITGISPNGAWIFGGLVAEIRGRDFTGNAQVFFGASEAEVLEVAADGETLWVVVPPLASESNDATVTVDVLVRDLERDSLLLQGFTYTRRALEDNLVVTAFFFDPAADFVATMPLAAGQSAELAIPVSTRGLAVPGVVAGLFRAGNNSLSLGTSAISGVPPVSSFTEFDLHLYEDVGEALPLRPSAPALEEITDWSYPADEEENRISVTIPLPGVNLQTNDVRNGLSLWRARTLLDYRTLASSFQPFPVVAYETFVLASDSTPDANAAPAGTDLTALLVRLNGTGAAALRRNIVPPPDVAEVITVDGTSSTSGDLSGGATLRLIAPLGGLGWVDRVELQTVTGDLVAVATAELFQTPPGTTDLALALTIPPAQCTGAVNVVVYLKSRSQISFAVLPQAFTYTGEAAACDTGGTTGGCPAASLSAPAPPAPGDAAVLAGALALMALAAVMNWNRHRVRTA